MQPTELLTGQTEIGPDITDVAGEPATPEQLERLIARYHWAASYCTGRIVLEVACGTGQGLGLLRSRAQRVFACDLNSENLENAKRGNGPDQPLLQVNAQALPFADKSVDVVIILEALYFLPSSDEFLDEVTRVLRPNGWLLVSAINKDSPDFNPRHSLYRELYGTRELAAQFRRHGLEPECFGIIPMDEPSFRRRAFSPLKRLAVGLNVIPESKRARIFLKRIVFGELQRMPHDITTAAAPAVEPTPVSTEEPDRVHQVILYAGKLT